MRALMRITKALADENRVRILMALRGGELCVCQITELLGLSPSTISSHLAILYRAEMVVSRKKGRWIYYRLAEVDGPKEAAGAMDWVCACVKRDPQIIADAAQLKVVLKQDASELCKRQCRK